MYSPMITVEHATGGYIVRLPLVREVHVCMDLLSMLERVCWAASGLTLVEVTGAWDGAATPEADENEGDDASPQVS